VHSNSTAHHITQLQFHCVAAAVAGSAATARRILAWAEWAQSYSAPVVATEVILLWKPTPCVTHCSLNAPEMHSRPLSLTQKTFTCGYPSLHPSQPPAHPPQQPCCNALPLVCGGVGHKLVGHMTGAQVVHCCCSTRDCLQHTQSLC
jgi:hypothetical protein